MYQLSHSYVPRQTIWKPAARKVWTTRFINYPSYSSNHTYIKLLCLQARARNLVQRSAKVDSLLLEVESREKPVNRCFILLGDFHATISWVTYPTFAFCNWCDEQHVDNFRFLPAFQARDLFRVPGAAAGRGLPAQTSWPVTRGPTRARRISFARSATRGSWDPTTLGEHKLVHTHCKNCLLQFCLLNKPS